MPANRVSEILYNYILQGKNGSDNNKKLKSNNACFFIRGDNPFTSNLNTGNKNEYPPVFHSKFDMSQCI